MVREEPLQHWVIKHQLHSPANLGFFVQIRWLRLVKEEPLRSYERPTLGAQESLTQPCKFRLFCANKMAPGFSEVILRAEHESDRLHAPLK